MLFRSPTSGALVAADTGAVHEDAQRPLAPSDIDGLCYLLGIGYVGLDEGQTRERLTRRAQVEGQNTGSTLDEGR